MQRVSPFLILSLLLIMAACGTPDDTTPQESEPVATETAESDSVAADVNDGVQEIRVTVRNDGYTPSHVVLQEDIPARMIFVQEGTSACASQVQIPAFDVAATDLPVGAETVVEFTPDESGEFSFLCGMDMLEGTIVVRS